jgi:hypothetical protein
LTWVFTEAVVENGVVTYVEIFPITSHAIAPCICISSRVFGRIANSRKSFNISGSGSDQFSSLVFPHRITNTSTGFDLKFDVVVNDYAWVSSDSNAALLLNWRFATNGNEKLTSTATNGTYTVQLGNVYFDVQLNADASSGDVNVLANVTESGKSVDVIYSHFQGSLRHDPGFGTSRSGWAAWQTALLALGIVAFIALIVVGVVLYRKKHSYDVISK